MKKNECQELVNIKYQTMLLNNNKTNIYKKADDTISNMEMFLEEEKKTTKHNPWSKLSTTERLKKIEVFIETYSTKKKLTPDEKDKLKKFLKTCLDRKKLQRVKDVEYDTKTGEINNIVGLTYSKIKSKFTLKNKNTKPSSLRSLAPKKTRKIPNKDKKDKKEKRVKKDKKSKIEKKKPIKKETIKKENNKKSKNKESKTN